jgi:hypothetical protein
MWFGRMIMLRRYLPPSSSGKKQAEMSAIIQKTTIKLQLFLTQEINTENTVEGETKRKEDP